MKNLSVIASAMPKAPPSLLSFSPSVSATLSSKGAGPIRAVIYLDVLLLVNFITSALFLLAAGLLCGVEAAGLRVVGGSVLGALSSLILLAPTAPWPLGLAYQLCAGAAPVLAAYGWPGARCFLRLWAWFAALHLALTGAVLLPGAQTNNFSVYLPLSPGLLLACTGGIWLAVQGALRVLGRRHGQVFPVVLCVAGVQLSLRAFCDTGFSVREPLTGREVVLVRWGAVRSRLPPPLAAYLSVCFSGGTAPPPPELGLCFVPCSTVSGHCILPAVPAALASSPSAPLYAAFADLPPPPEGWDVLVALSVNA